MHRTHNKWRKPKSRLSRDRNDQLRKARAALSRTTEAPDRPSTSQQPDVNTPSTSGRKIALFKRNAPEQQIEEDFYIVQSDAMNQLIQKTLCASCGQHGLTVTSVNVLGFARSFRLTCEKCGHDYGDTYSSPRVEDTRSTRPPFTINRRMVESFAFMGEGYAAMEILGKEVGMQIFSSTAYFQHMKKIEEENCALKEEMLRKVHETIRENLGVGPEETIDLAVSYDGTWQKRGHVSLNGAAFVIDLETGLVLDFVILSKYCHMCALKASREDTESESYQDWLEAHKHSQQCQINYVGSSGAMEKTAAKILWERSEEKWHMRYTKLLSDGDASTFDHLCQLDPYNGVPIEKEECINHCAKRLGTALRDLVQKEKAKGVTLGGRKEGSLKDTTITKLTSYYRNAVVDNLPNIGLMQQRIMATVDHCSSTDEKPNHDNCPEGPDSWCFYNKAIALNEVPKSHTQMSLRLSSLVSSKVKPIYTRLSNPALLERCSRGGTQNSNESLHSIVWKKCSKEVFASRSRIEVAAVQAVTEFNLGQTTAIQVRRGDVSSTALKIAHGHDTRRVKRSEGQKETTAKRAKRKCQKAAEAKQARKSKDYQAGGH